MQVKYLVQNPHMTQMSIRADHNGVPLAASVEGLEVSLRAMDSQNGGMTLRFIGSDAEAAKEMFKNDAIVTATFAASDEKYEVK